MHRETIGGCIRTYRCGSKQITQDKLLIVTDLDATLLSSDYTWADALPVLAQLKTHGHVLFFNSSKTHMELVELASDMDLDTPIIADSIPNGWPQEMDTAPDEPGEPHHKNQIEGNYNPVDGVHSNLLKTTLLFRLAPLHLS